MAASVWRGRITFGLVSIPVRLVKAARRERIRFQRVSRAARVEEPAEDFEEGETPAAPSRVLEFPSKGRGAAPPPPVDEEGPVVPVRNAAVSGTNDAPVMRSEILKGFAVSKDQFVVVAPEDVAALRPKTSAELEITEFVKVQDIDPIHLDTSYYVVPDKGGEKPYGLLFATLKETGHAGMGSLAMHGREHVVVIRAGHEALVLHSMFYANEVGRPPYLVEGEGATAKELSLAKMLVGALEANFAPEKWKDSYEERLKALVESRTPVASAGAPELPEAQVPATDILEMLRKSLERARKPVSREEKAPQTKRAPAKRK
jgi:DNA end-binding protein Ku